MAASGDLSSLMGTEASSTSEVQDAAVKIVGAVIESNRGNCEPLCKEMVNVTTGWRTTRRENMILRLAIDRMKVMANTRQGELEAEVR